MLKDAVGFGQRTSRGHEVIEDKAAFVHRGQKVGPESLIADKCGGDKNQAYAADPERLGEGPVQNLLMELKDAAEHPSWLVLFALFRRFMFFEQYDAEARCPGDGEHERCEKRGGHGDGKRTEEDAGDAAYRDKRQKDNDRRNGGADEGSCDLFESLSHSFNTGFAGVAVHDNVFDHHDGVVDDEADGGGEAAQRHEVESFSDEPEGQHRDGDGDGNDEAGNQGGGPVAQEEKKDDAGQNYADGDGVADAGDAVAHQLRLIVKEIEFDAWRQIFAELGYLGGDRIGDGNRIARWLTGDGEEHRLFSVGSDGGVDRHSGLHNGCHIGNADRRACGRGFDYKLAQSVSIVHLRSDEPQDQLVVGFVKAGRIDDVRSLDGIDEVLNGDTGGEQQGGIGNDMELRHLAALHRNGTDASGTIERRLEVVCRNFPKIGLRNRVGGEAVAEDGEGGNGDSVGGDPCRGRQGLLDLAESCIHQLQGEDHVGVPVEHEIDFSRSTAGDGADGNQPGHCVDRIFNGLGDGDLHLFDRHDAVVDADDDAGKVSGREDRNGDLKRNVDACHHEHGGEEEDGARGPGKPERFPVAGLFVRHQSVPPALLSSAAGPTFTFVPSSSP